MCEIRAGSPAAVIIGRSLFGFEATARLLKTVSTVKFAVFETRKYFLEVVLIKSQEFALLGASCAVISKNFEKLDHSLKQNAN